MKIKMLIASNKKIVSVVLFTIIIVSILLSTSLYSNKQEWLKYAGHPDNTFVTNKELEIQKQKIYDESKQLILDTISNENVAKQLDYLNKQKLSDDNQLKYDNIQKTYTSFEKTKDYTLDEIIALAADYTKMATDLNSLYTEIKTTELTKAINDLDSQIKKHQEGITKLTLTDSEQKEFDKQIKLYKDVKLNKEATYTLDELENIKATFTGANKQLESLSNKAKDRIATEQAKADKQLAQSVGYTESNYTGNTNTSTSNTNKSNKSNTVSGASTSSRPSYCTYTTEASAIAYGESTGRGWDVTYCGRFDGVEYWFITIFDGDNTGNNNGFYIE